ncbi:glutaredoxin 2 [Kingella oralis]|jgi:glutaredoxin, grxB family|uniref:Glutaredoxin, GrxB family n=1 Tax=Kingella oralis ATCC 51147 TaxID=629741 RepID=C4GF17_9NEIS|nr:glutaredoxin 2 [Kingella oralis]EEP68822.1 glutaredoxin, GrxB family [Kingella oralis ATCC 51147]QMT41975.1 glutaredoxin 2 [Kingella oralis]
MKLYIYDHCPFCVRARMIFGIQQIPVELITLANDDEATPIRLIGAKQVPILQKLDGSYMGESLDIVRHINAQAKRPISETIRPSIQAWADKVGEYYNQLLFPRSIQLGLPEFATPAAVVYFILKKEASIGTGIAQMLDKTPELLAQIHSDLQTLASQIHSDTLNGSDLSMEDILIFPMLRNLTMVRGIQFPAVVQDYIANMAQRSQINTYFDRAL